MKNIQISVIIPFYNTPINLFSQCIESVKDLNPKEIILVDDCSTDNRVIELAKKSGCIYLKTDKQSGADGTPFNLGVKKAKSPYICRVDSDDVLLELPKSMTTEICLGNIKRVGISSQLSIEELILAPRAIFNAMVIEKKLLLKYPLEEDINVFTDVLLVLRLLYNKHTFTRFPRINYIYSKRENSVQTSKSNFYHRLSLVQTVSRFCQLENIPPKKSLYYLKLAMMNVQYGSSSLIKFREMIKNTN